MKIKLNKNQFLDDYELEYRKCMNRDFHRESLTSAPLREFETVEVTEEELMEYIKKGYGIKINC